MNRFRYHLPESYIMNHITTSHFTSMLLKDIISFVTQEMMMRRDLSSILSPLFNSVVYILCPQTYQK